MVIFFWTGENPVRIRRAAKMKNSLAFFIGQAISK
jgi:hypothetical protein